jgi:CTP synthase
MTNAGHTETDPDTDLPLLVIASCPIDNPAMTGPKLQGQLKISLIPGTIAYKIYGKPFITESFNCNYELNPEYREKLESKGLVVGGISENGRARIIELPDKQFFMGTGFLPQLNSTSEKPHPLFIAYLQAANEHSSTNLSPF